MNRIIRIVSKFIKLFKKKPKYSDEQIEFARYQLKAIDPYWLKGNITSLEEIAHHELTSERRSRDYRIRKSSYQAIS